MEHIYSFIMLWKCPRYNTVSSTIKCTWKEINVHCMLLTSTTFGIMGGGTCFFSSCSQSKSLKNGCPLIVAGSASLSEGSLARNWQQKQTINAMLLYSSQMLQVCKQTVHNWCKVLTAWHWVDLCCSIESKLLVLIITARNYLNTHYVNEQQYY